MFVVASFLFAGLWTSVSAGLAAGLAFWALVTSVGDIWSNILLGAIGVALYMTGPGEWSLDARLFAWRQITIRDLEE
jgi:uncharacterized membrane protein YphA (DoxX/SURF4 family)